LIYNRVKNIIEQARIVQKSPHNPLVHGSSPCRPTN